MHFRCLERWRRWQELSSYLLNEWALNVLNTLPKGSFIFRKANIKISSDRRDIFKRWSLKLQGALTQEVRFRFLATVCKNPGEAKFNPQTENISHLISDHFLSHHPDFFFPSSHLSRSAIMVLIYVPSLTGHFSLPFTSRVSTWLALFPIHT